MIRKKKLKKEIKKPLLKAETEPIKKTKIRVIGIGGGGSSIVSEIAQKVKKISFVVANTDLRALRESAKKARHFQFGQSITAGLGTGMSVELGKIAAENEKERIKELLKGIDFCILVACLGGGTGSGAAPIFAKISRNLGNITYGIFTLPFKFEGEKKMEIAKDCIEKLKPNLNAITIIPNERIFQIIDKTTPLKSALSQINKTLAEGLEGLIETIYQPGLINIDFADLKTILEKKGRLTYLNTIEADAIRVKEAIPEVLNCPLYPYNIWGAKGVLFNIAGQKSLGLAEVNQISKSISELVNKEAKIIFGVSPGKKYQNKIKITLLATGCGFRPSLRIGPKKKPQLKVRLPKVTLPKPEPEKESKLGEKPREEREKKPLSLEGRQVKKKKPKVKKKKIKVEVPAETPSTRKEESPKTDSSLKPGPEVTNVEIKEITPPGRKVRLQSTPHPKKEIPTTLPAGGRVRKNALQIKKEIEEAEKEILKQEKIWEAPAFLRRKKEYGSSN